MAVINSLLFLLTTLSPLHEPTQDSSVPYEEWHRGLRPAENSFDDNTRTLDFIPDVSNIKDSPCNPNITGPFQCPPGEHYQRCGQFCPPDCYGSPCPYNCCVEGCFCNEGLVRGPDSNCISKEDCPKNGVVQEMNKCPEGEEFTYCHSELQKHCPNHSNLSPRLHTCHPGCICRDQKVRGPDGRCIPIEDCPTTTQEGDRENAAFQNIRPSLQGEVSAEELDGPQSQFFSCKRNEEYKMCPSSCPDDCNNFLNRNRACKFICLPIPGCQCKTGFVKGPDGDCIKSDQCPSHEKKPEDCTGLEYYDICGTSCEDNCTDYNLPDKSCVKKCVIGCFCLPGYVRGLTGECVWPFDCWPNSNGHAVQRSSNPRYCPRDEEYLSCGTACPTNCTNYDREVNCTKDCVAGCFCKDPLIRGPDGKCIYKDDCHVDEQSSGPCRSRDQEFLSCGPACPKNCSNFDKEVPCPPRCVPGCFCKFPKIIGPNGNCISKDKCPVDQERTEDSLLGSGPFPGFCKRNEEFSAFSSLCPDNCDNYETPWRPCNMVVVPGCKCREGYVRERSGICIKKEQCREERPEDCTEYENFDHCGSYCEPDCINYNSDTCDDKRCKKGCFCLPGFVRGPNWECIPERECPNPL